MMRLLCMSSVYTSLCMHFHGYGIVMHGNWIMIDMMYIY